jgi:hypothetical protein
VLLDGSKGDLICLMAVGNETNPYAAALYQHADEEFQRNSEITGIAPNTEGVEKDKTTVLALCGSLPSGTLQISQSEITLVKGAWRSDRTDSIIVMVMPTTGWTRSRVKNSHAWLLRPEACFYYSKNLPPLEDELAIDGLKRVISAATWDVDHSRAAATDLSSRVPVFV